MDILDGLMDQRPEEVLGRPRRRELVRSEELVLPRAGLIGLYVAREAERLPAPRRATGEGSARSG